MITPDDMQNALAELLSARLRAVEALGPDDPDDPANLFLDDNLPLPASADDIAALEATFGTLPPSYRAFLNLHDGLPEADSGQDIYSVAKLFTFREKHMQKSYAKFADAIGNRPMEGLLVIGGASSRKSLFMFDTKKADGDGEWPVLYHSNDEGLLDEYDSFHGFVVDLTQTLIEIAEDFE